MNKADTYKKGNLNLLETKLEKYNFTLTKTFLPVKYQKKIVN